MAEYPGSNNSNTMQGNTKEVYPKDKPKKKSFKKILSLLQK
jgi:hypothetical protein